jgi:hypothetical protein
MMSAKCTALFDKIDEFSRFTQTGSDQARRNGR